MHEITAIQLVEHGPSCFTVEAWVDGRYHPDASYQTSELDTAVTVARIMLGVPRGTRIEVGTRIERR